MPSVDCLVVLALHVGEGYGVHVLELGLGVGLELEHVVHQLEVGDGPGVFAVPMHKLSECFVPPARDQVAGHAFKPFPLL